MSRSASPAADLKSLSSHQQRRSDRDAIESLEALWNPSSSDDGRATLEQLQSAVASQGTSRGLNGMALTFILASVYGHYQYSPSIPLICIRGVWPPVICGGAGYYLSNDECAGVGLYVTWLGE